MTDTNTAIHPAAENSGGNILLFKGLETQPAATAIACRTPHLCMQSQAEHSEHPKTEDSILFWAERPSSISSPDWLFSPTLLQSGDVPSCMETGELILVEAPWSLGRATWEDSWAQGWQHLSAGHGHTHRHCLRQQRGKELPQPPNWAFCLWTHCDLGMGSQLVTEQPGDPQLDWSIGSILEELCARGSCCRRSSECPH